MSDITPLKFKEKCVSCGHAAIDHVWCEGPCKPYIKTKPNGCESKCQKFVPPKCLHNRENKVEAKLTYIEDCERYVLDIKAECGVCGIRFRFLKLPAGYHIANPTVNVVGLEASLPIHPENEEPPPLPLKGAKGFSITVKP